MADIEPFLCSNYARRGRMQTSELLVELGYTDSPNFLRAEDFGEALEHTHVFRRAAESFRLHGIYLLRQAASGAQDLSTPVIYVAEAASRQEADAIHRKVWNQNVVPFLLVRVPEGVWLYSGFSYDWKTIPRSQQPEQQGVLEAAISFNEVATKLSAFRAHAIDDGTIWRTHGHQVQSSTRVDWRLLGNLEKLGKWLHEQGRLDKDIANAVIGKFVYLRYLKDRGILSERKLREWGIDLGQVFGRAATMEATRNLIENVDDWLNGAIFPFPFTGKRAPKIEHVRRVAEIFLGDEPSTGQLHLDFQPYDFSYIPIETLSVIYEQFLASEGKDKPSGAYYTPIPLVNFMLAELDDHLPLKPGMRVLDPACGSGAFLVQCYRRLIERRIRETERPLRPVELRDLLVKHIYGVDHDASACRVAALSLVLTMLDYIKPPDLQSTPSFKLPDLHNRNIFHGDFFDPHALWHEASSDGYDWIIGNPPWKPVKSGDHLALTWMQAHATTCPVVDKQIAEAFAWKASTHLANRGMVGLLLPAMTFFKQGDAFRTGFLQRMEILAVANFSNLRRDLFDERVEAPAAAVFYTARGEHSDQKSILVYSPLLINQEFGRPTRDGHRVERKETWAISLNASEVRQISSASVSSGDSLPWKAAMWGSQRDLRLLNRIERDWPRLDEVLTTRSILIREGMQLRDERGRESVEYVSELVNKHTLAMAALRNLGRLYSFPCAALKPVEPHMCFARKRGGLEPLKVCRPPHVIVGAARTFAIFSDDYIIVPPRQIGISGDLSQRSFLIALSLYLSADFTQYYEFFRSPQGGIREGRSTLETLKSLPCPIGSLDDSALREWSVLQAELTAASSVRWLEASSDGPLFEDQTKIEDRIGELNRLEGILNDRVNDLLGLGEAERLLIQDLIHTRRRLTDGNVGEEAERVPTKDELFAYASTLAKTLNDFVGVAIHDVTLVQDQLSGLVEVTVVTEREETRPARVYTADEIVGSELAKLRNRLLGEAGQWIYFDRNLQLYRDNRIYLLKPMQRVAWTRSQALLDADEILASALAPEGI
jgi:hypothetical protein